MEKADEPRGITSITSYALQEQVSTQDRTICPLLELEQIGEVDEEVVALVAK